MKRRWRDIYVAVKQEDIINDMEKQFAEKLCNSCEATGNKHLSEKVYIMCPDCHGKGYI